MLLPLDFVAIFGGLLYTTAHCFQGFPLSFSGRECLFVIAVALLVFDGRRDVFRS